jgi:hypothetical protein
MSDSNPSVETSHYDSNVSSGLMRRLEAKSYQPGALRGSGDGGDGMDGLVSRVASLEAHMEHVREGLTSVKDDTSSTRERLTAIEVKVENLPTKGFIVTALVSVLALITALILFKDQVSALLGSVPKP